ncbi:MarC family protein [Granulicella paludicola]|uniref:MarC family protein n=1 Tax=Granulicella paludicola TaxID=474951 RepID=UPI0021E0A36D|nr:MarC family protein [Granulicella paludicola]
MNLYLLWKFFALAFSALLPLVNPLGSALIFVGVVGPASIGAYRSLARRIAINTLGFFLIVEIVGSAVLNFFGISLPIVQVSGGLVIAAMGWGLLNQKDSDTSEKKVEIKDDDMELSHTLSEKTFYPYTFPLTVGPGSLVVTLTLSAQATQHTLTMSLIAHAGILLAALLMAVAVYFCYSNAPRITQAISPSTAHGILRVVAFFLLCIGVQIAWNGLSALLTPLLKLA